MKKFTVHYNYYATADVEVLANSQEEAIKKADQVEIPNEEFDLEYDNREITHEEDVPDLPNLIEEAEKIIKKAYDEDITFRLDPWPRVHMEFWNGERIGTSYELTENVYWNPDDDEIGFTLSGGADAILSEFPEVEQLTICQSIIAQAEANNIKDYA